MSQVTLSVSEFYASYSDRLSECKILLQDQPYPILDIKPIDGGLYYLKSDTFSYDDLGSEETLIWETPDQETPDQETPDQETPDQETPDQETPDQETPDQETPDHSIDWELIVAALSTGAVKDLKESVKDVDPVSLGKIAIAVSKLSGILTEKLVKSQGSNFVSIDPKKNDPKKKLSENSSKVLEYRLTALSLFYKEHRELGVKDSALTVSRAKSIKQCGLSREEGNAQQASQDIAALSIVNYFLADLVSIYGKTKNETLETILPLLPVKYTKLQSALKLERWALEGDRSVIVEYDKKNPDRVSLCWELITGQITDEQFSDRRAKLV